jgi:hypothetical protein
MAEARSRFDPGLDAAELRTFLLLLGGHVLFFAVFFAAGALLEGNSLYLAAAVYGLPLVLFGPRDRRLERVLVLLVGIGVIHFCAVYLAIQSVPIPFTRPGLTDSVWVPGAIGGLVGAAGTFALCALAGLVRPGKRVTMIVATLVLTVIGSLGVRFGILREGPPAGDFAPFVIIYTPWQLVFAYFLAKTLR